MLPPTDDYLRSESCRHVPGWEEALVRLDLIVKGGSDRYYYRATAHGGAGPESAIIMVYTDKRADNPAFFSATEVLRCCGARTMEIYHHDAAQRIAWMEDLGRDDLWERRQIDPVLAYYRDTFKQGAFLHRRTAATCRKSCATPCSQRSTPGSINGSRGIFLTSSPAVSPPFPRSNWMLCAILPPLWSWRNPSPLFPGRWCTGISNPRTSSSGMADPG